MADSATAWAKASRVEEETSAAPGRSAVAAAKAGEAPSTKSSTTKSRSDGPASTEKSPAGGRAQEQACNQTGSLSRRILVASFADRHLLLVERLIGRRRGERLFVEIGDDLDVVILVASELDVLETDGDVLLADAEETAGANHDGDDLAVLVGDEVVHVANRLIVGIHHRLADEVTDEPVAAFLLGEEWSTRRGCLGRLRKLSGTRCL